MERYHTVLLYFKLDKEYLYTDSQIILDPSLKPLKFTDSSGSNATIKNITFDELLRLDTPRYQTTPQPLILSFWNDIAICTQL